MAKKLWFICHTPKYRRDDEDNDDDDYTGAVDGGNGLSATDLRGTIRGVVGNNSNGRAGLTGSESRAGVVVNLHAASAAIKSGTNKGRRTAKFGLSWRLPRPMTTVHSCSRICR